MNDMRAKSILIVDDDVDAVENMKTLLGKEGYNLWGVTSGQSALNMIKEIHFNLVLCDVSMPYMDGLSLLSKILNFDPSYTVIMVTGYANVEDAKRAIWAGAYDYLTKPLHVEKLLEVVRRGLMTRHVFIVHGHDEAAKDSVARYLERLRIRPVILQEQPNAGRTIIEKFEQYSNVGFAIVLLTPDDVGGPTSNPQVLQKRARQNVILELGYFLGKLGRKNVCALYKDDVELPSDYQGILYIKMDIAGAWRGLLAREFKQATVDFDATKIY